MAKITYVDAAGRATSIDAANGWSLMQAAVANGVDGIVGECGGSCACATCHCYVDEARLAELPEPDDNELAMLDLAAAEVRPNSRLSCQIRASDRIDGLVVHLPVTQG
jgi:ferredoxin, 2Fe-2S